MSDERRVLAQIASNFCEGFPLFEWHWWRWQYVRRRHLWHLIARDALCHLSECGCLEVPCWTRLGRFSMCALAAGHWGRHRKTNV